MLKNADRTVSQYLVHLRARGVGEISVAVGGALLALPNLEVSSGIPIAATTVLGLNGVRRIIRAERLWNGMRPLSSQDYDVAMNTLWKETI
jgi:hypothetical protein